MEEALNLSAVKINSHNTVGACQEISGESLPTASFRDYPSLQSAERPRRQRLGHAVWFSCLDARSHSRGLLRLSVNFHVINSSSSYPLPLRALPRTISVCGVTTI